MSNTQQNLKVSVVIPAYNEKANIRKVLTSLFEQKTEEGQKINPDTFEIIIVDNNSTDNTSGIVKRFHKEHSELNIDIVDEPKKGIIPARVRGFDYSLEKNNSLGQFLIASTDADVIVNPNWVDGIIRTFQNTGADFLVGDSHFGKPFWQKVPNLGAWIRDIKKDILQVENDFIFMLGGNNFAITNDLHMKIRGGLYEIEKSSDRVFGSNAKLAGAKFALLPHVNIVSYRRFVYIIEDLVKGGTYGVPPSDFRKTSKDVNKQMRKIDSLTKKGYFDSDKFIKFFIRDYMLVPLVIDHSLLGQNKKYFIGVEDKLKNDLEKLERNYWNNLNLAVEQATVLTEKYWREIYKNIINYASRSL